MTPAEDWPGKLFDIPLLADRLVDAIRWLDGQAAVAKFPLGLFGASTGAARRWWRRRSFLAGSVQWSRAAGAPTSPEMLLKRSRHRRF